MKPNAIFHIRCPNDSGWRPQGKYQLRPYVNSQDFFDFLSVFFAGCWTFREALPASPRSRGLCSHLDNLNRVCAAKMGDGELGGDPAFDAFVGSGP